MIVVRKYFEGFMNLFDKVRDFKDNDLLQFSKLKGNVEALITKCEKYQFLEIENIDYQVCDSDSVKDIVSERLNLLSILYKVIVDNLYSLHFTRVDGENYYEQKLWKALSGLNFNEYEYIRFYNEKFSDETLFSGFKLSYLRYDSAIFQSIKEKYKGYVVNPPKEDILLEREVYVSILDKFKEKLSDYNHFIITNYSAVASQFGFFQKDIRLYILDAPSGGKYTCKVIAYENNGEFDVKVHDKILTLSNRLGCLEEIDKNVSESFLSVFDFDLEFLTSIFSTSRIYYDALQIFYRNHNSLEIFNLFKYVLNLNKITVSAVNDSLCTLSILTKENEQKLLCCFEKEFHIETFKKHKNQYDKYIFLTKPDNSIMGLLGENKISYAYNYIDSRFHLEAIHYFIRDKLAAPQLSRGPLEGKRLIDSLAEIQRGKRDWNKYENLCIEIFKYLFKDSFRHFSYEKQSITENNIHRRDLLINNLPKSPTTFWADIKDTYKSNAIICEFKNYSEALNTDTLYNVTKYVNTLYNFIIVFSRSGCDTSASELQLKLLRERKTLVMVLDDVSIVNMLKEKDMGIDILYRLENLKFEVEKKL